MSPRELCAPAAKEYPRIASNSDRLSCLPAAESYIREHAAKPLRTGTTEARCG